MHYYWCFELTETPEHTHFKSSQVSPPLDLQLEAEVRFSKAIRLKISSGDTFAPSYYPQSSKYHFSQLFEGNERCSTQNYTGSKIINIDGSKTKEGTALTFSAYTKKFLPLISTQRFTHNRYLYLFLTNYEPFQKLLYNINKRDSPLYICVYSSTSLHYVLDSTLS